MKINQSYYNIITGITISLLVAMILGAFAWVGRMQSTVNKADLALREIERNEKEMMRKNKVYHGRISKNTDEIKKVKERAIMADVQSEINFHLITKGIK